jgi:hypothetical protein
MSNQSHKHSRQGHKHEAESSGWKPHKDWRAWLVVVLMVMAVIMYVLSLDDSVIPR